MSSTPVTSQKFVPSATFARIAKALADPQRQELLEKLAKAGELCCAALVGQCPVSQATVSHHLKELVNAGLVERRKVGQFAYFRFVPRQLASYTEELARRMGLCGTTPER